MARTGTALRCRCDVLVQQNKLHCKPLDIVELVQNDPLCTYECGSGFIKLLRNSCMASFCIDQILHCPSCTVPWLCFTSAWQLLKVASMDAQHSSKCSCGLTAPEQNSTEAHMSSSMMHSFAAWYAGKARRMRLIGHTCAAACAHVVDAMITQLRDMGWMQLNSQPGMWRRFRAPHVASWQRIP